MFLEQLSDCGYQQRDLLISRNPLCFFKDETVIYWHGTDHADCVLDNKLITYSVDADLLQSLLILMWFFFLII